MRLLYFTQKNYFFAINRSKQLQKIIASAIENTFKVNQDPLTSK